VNSHALQGGIVRTVDEWMMTIDEILQGATPDGLTISGGEPTLQANAVGGLINAFRSRYAGIDVLLYSGQPWIRLQRIFPGLIRECDVLISEPYVAEIPPRSSLHGSGNQTIHLLTPLAKRRYLGLLSGAEPRPLAVTSVTGRQISAVGIPCNIDQLAIALGKRGIKLEQPSWRN
jgi:anaerobic ribonucleoside-triphosphate reductase activating protein